MVIGKRLFAEPAKVISDMFFTMKDLHLKIQDTVLTQFHLIL
jgi:hypothetical protein